MIRYNLARLAREKGYRGHAAKMPPIEDRLSARRSYLAALRVMIKAVTVQMRETIITRYRPNALTRDVDADSFRTFREYAAALSRVASQTVERIIGLESQTHTENFMDNARRVFGIDLQAVVRQEDLTEYLELAIERNTSLIKSLSDDMVKRVEQTVIANELNGRSVGELRKALVEQLGIVDRRAKLIARDQTAKLNSDMNRIRQQQAGIDKYEWLTAGDERVRQLHQGLQGKVYKWGESTGAEGGLPPGQPIQCRCVAVAVVSFDFD